MLWQENARITLSAPLLLLPPEIKSVFPSLSLLAVTSHSVNSMKLFKNLFQMPNINSNLLVLNAVYVYICLCCPLGIWVSGAQSNNPTRQQAFSLCSDLRLANDAFAFACNLDSAVLLAAGSFHFSPPAGRREEASPPAAFLPGAALPPHCLG